MTRLVDIQLGGIHLPPAIVSESGGFEAWEWGPWNGCRYVLAVARRSDLLCHMDFGESVPSAFVTLVVPAGGFAPMRDGSTAGGLHPTYVREKLFPPELFPGAASAEKKQRIEDREGGFHIPPFTQQEDVVFVTLLAATALGRVPIGVELEFVTSAIHSHEVTA